MLKIFVQDIFPILMSEVYSHYQYRVIYEWPSKIFLLINLIFPKLKSFVQNRFSILYPKFILAINLR